MHDLKSLGEETLRIRRMGPRPPMRTLAELAEEFGVDIKRLRHCVTMRNAPAPLVHKSGTAANTRYYVHADMRKWWKSINQGEPNA